MPNHNAIKARRIQAEKRARRKGWLVTRRDDGCFMIQHQETVVRSEKVRVDFGVLMHLHFLQRALVNKSHGTVRVRVRTHHLEGVELFLDLLGEHGREAVARSNLAPTVVLAAGPCIVKHDPRAERCVALVSLWSARSTLRILPEPQGRHKVVFIANSNRACPAVTLGLVVGGAGYARHGRLGHLRGQIEGRSAALLFRRRRG